MTKLTTFQTEAETTLQPVQTVSSDRDWLPLPGGELEAPRPSALCAGCRDVRRRLAEAGGTPAAHSKALCLNCYRSGRDRDRKLAAARDLNTASEARFQVSLPFEPVNRARLNQLRAARQEAREADRRGPGMYVDKRRKAQIEARHALQRLAEGLRERGILVVSGRAS